MELINVKQPLDCGLVKIASLENEVRFFKAVAGSSVFLVKLGLLNSDLPVATVSDCSHGHQKRALIPLLRNLGQTQYIRVMPYIFYGLNKK